MFDAVHKETEELYDAHKIWDKFDDPHKEEWICCLEENNPVTPVKEHTRNREDNKKESIWVRPHFRILSGEGCKRGGETPTHKKLKKLVAALVSSKKLNFYIDGRNIPIKELKFKDVIVEENIEGKRERPDVKARLESFHPFLGKGILFEVEWKSNRTLEERKKRNDLFTGKGWSVIWIDKKEIDQNEIKLKKGGLEVSCVYFRNEVHKKARNELIGEFRDEIEAEKKKTKDEIRSLGRNITDTIQSEIRYAIKNSDEIDIGRWIEEARSEIHNMVKDFEEGLNVRREKIERISSPALNRKIIIHIPKWLSRKKDNVGPWINEWEKISESEKAILIKTGNPGRNVWLPKSELSYYVVGGSNEN